MKVNFNNAFSLGAYSVQARNDSRLKDIDFAIQP